MRLHRQAHLSQILLFHEQQKAHKYTAQLTPLPGACFGIPAILDVVFMHHKAEIPAIGQLFTQLSGHANLVLALCPLRGCF